MSAKIKYTDEPLGEPKVIPDFLPAPEDLVFDAYEKQHSKRAEAFEVWEPDRTRKGTRKRLK